MDTDMEGECLGTKQQRNEFSNNLLNNLVKAQESSMVIRVGGNSA
jgi:hypothetical protein